jgi:hypothetical protein
MAVVGLACGVFAAPAWAGDTTATAVLTNLNPSVFGQPVTFTATVSDLSFPGTTPTGSVTFTDGTGLGAPVLATVTLAAGHASLTTSTLSAAGSPHTIKGTYNPDAAGFNASAATTSQTVNKASTTLAFGSSGSPSVFGQPVTFGATALPVAPGGGTPAGNVTFTIDGAAQPPVPTSGGNAKFMTSSLGVLGSPHSVSASFADTDGNYNNSSANLSGGQTVNPADTQIAVTSSQNPSNPGDSVTFTATASAASPGSGNPTGNVTFMDGSTPIGTAPLSGGAASLATSSLAAGDHTIIATNSGDSNFNSGVGSLDQTVTPPDTTPPTLGGYELSRLAFAAASKGGSVGKKKVGTKVTFTLSEPATVHFKVKKAKSGKALKGGFRDAGVQGKNSFKFTGRLRHKKLKPGTYKLVATAFDAAGNPSVPEITPFQIVSGG